MSVENEKKEKILTLCLIYKHPRVLLGMKKKGFGAGRWNGFGGKVLETESVEEAARREVREDVGVSVHSLEQIGELRFEFKDSSERLKVFVFKADQFEGEVIESDEMRPSWFYVDEIPFKDMWPGDVYWMPLFFAGRKFKGEFVFADEDNLIDRNIELVD